MTMQSLSKPTRTIAASLSGAAVAIAVAASQGAAQAPMNSSGFGQLPGAGGCTMQEGSTLNGCAAGKGLAGAAAVLVSPDGKQVYVGSHTVGNGSATYGAIATFNRSSNGTLTEASCVSSDRTDGVDGTAGSCGAAPGLSGTDGLAMSSDGTSVYAASKRGDSLVVFSRNASTGVLTQLGCFASVPTDEHCVAAKVLTGADAVTVSPDGKNVYVSSGYANAIDEFTRDPATGKLTEIGCVSDDSTTGICSYGNAMKGPSSIGATPDGKFVYLSSTVSHSVNTYARDASTGALTQIGCLKLDAQVGGSCAAGKLIRSVSSLAISGDGASLYVAGESPATITALKRDTASGAISESACFDYLTPPPPPDTTTDDSTDSSGDSTARAKTRQTSTADPCTSIPGIYSVRSLALAPDGSHLYSVGTGNVSIFNRDTAGNLRQSACISVDDTRCGKGRALDGPSSAATSPDGNNLYVASGGNSIASFGPGVAMPSSRAVLRRDGSAFIAMACPARAHSGCAGTVTLRRPGAPHRGRPHRRRAQVARSAALGVAAFHLRSGQAGYVRIRLDRSTRRLARRRGGVALVAVTTSSVAASGTASQRVIVRASGRHG
ncbi:MAG TPA: beta-propeller fold lactonase family protein [Solirubrobacteraceae bacterium]|jgi:DNA-binding beta-propeller fold protein YncE|nr:beta-propeller fold lactonase family protein [Solirubrobacteraceae bacterium]